MKHIITLIIIILCLSCCQHRDNLQKEVLSLYELGKYYKENDLADSAFTYYSKAFKLAKEHGNDSLIGAIGNSLGDILQLQNLYKNAIQIHSESFIYNNKLDDKTAAFTSLRAIGKDYLYNTNPNDSIYKLHMDSAFTYFTKAAQLIPQIKSQEEMSAVYNNFCLYYTMDKQYKKALHYNMKAIQFCKDSTNQYRNYLSRGNIYFLLQQTDSAIYYCNHGIKSKNIYTRCAIYYKLADIHSLLGSADSAKYMKLARTLHNSIEQQKNGEEIMQKIQKGKLELLAHQKERNTILTITIILTIACSGFIIYRKYYHKRFTTQQKELETKHKLTQTLQQELQESKQIENYAELKASKQSEEESIITKIILLGKECAKRFTEKQTYKDLNKRIELTNEERKLLSKAILKEFRNYIKEINSCVQMAEEDYLICCLSLIGLSTKQCAICRGVGEAAIRVQRKRIKEKLKTFFHSEKLYESIFVRKG